MSIENQYYLLIVRYFDRFDTVFYNKKAKILMRLILSNSFEYKKKIQKFSKYFI